ncbi:TetR/AcrR family transcriptional regulator [Actinacidiphila acididurans]|nr:TetR/AcrR family transcriptional regulator [Actinacidiphila acididurans]
MTAGRDLFAGHGYDRTTIGQVCSSAKVSMRAFYEEFDSKQALLLAVHEKVTAAGMEAVAAVMRAPDIDSVPTAERIGRLFGAFAEAVTQDVQGAKVAYVEVLAAGREVEEHRLMWRSLWTDFFVAEMGRAVKLGEAVDRDYSLAIVALIGAVNEVLAHWSRQARSVPPALLARELARLTLGTLGVPIPEEW